MHITMNEEETARTFRRLAFSNDAGVISVWNVWPSLLFRLLVVSCFIIAHPPAHELLSWWIVKQNRPALAQHSTREITTCRSSSLHHQQGIDLNLSCSSQHRRNIEVLLSDVHHNSLPFCCATEAKIILYRIRRDKYLLQETNPIAQRCYLNLSYILLYLLLHVSCCALQKFFCR